MSANRLLEVRSYDGRQQKPDGSKGVVFAFDGRNFEIVSQNPIKALHRWEDRLFIVEEVPWNTLVVSTFQLQQGRR